MSAMPGEWTSAIALIYAAGVLLGLARVDADAFERVWLAVLWPLGPLACVVTIATLIIASLVAFPLWGLLVVAASGVALWLTW